MGRMLSANLQRYWTKPLMQDRDLDVHPSGQLWTKRSFLISGPRVVTKQIALACDFTVQNKNIEF